MPRGPPTLTRRLESALQEQERRPAAGDDRAHGRPGREEVPLGQIMPCARYLRREMRKADAVAALTQGAVSFGTDGRAPGSRAPLSAMLATVCGSDAGLGSVPGPSIRAQRWGGREPRTCCSRSTRRKDARQTEPILRLCVPEEGRGSPASSPVQEPADGEAAGAGVQLARFTAEPCVEAARTTPARADAPSAAAAAAARAAPDARSADQQDGSSSSCSFSSGGEAPERRPGDDGQGEKALAPGRAAALTFDENPSSEVFQGMGELDPTYKIDKRNLSTRWAGNERQAEIIPQQPPAWAAAILATIFTVVITLVGCLHHLCCPRCKAMRIGQRKDWPATKVQQQQALEQEMQRRGHGGIGAVRASARARAIGLSNGKSKVLSDALEKNLAFDRKPGQGNGKFKGKDKSCGNVAAKQIDPDTLTPVEMTAPAHPPPPPRPALAPPPRGSLRVRGALFMFVGIALLPQPGVSQRPSGCGGTTEGTCR